ncbi:MAG TPA: hypothetical protein VGS28_01315 [Candidatus Saccharimonadales bacterium]|nr:hypothetical protein [Candidatus Saccharimonadales bacterium]
MKKNDIAVIILIVSISLVVSFFVGKSLLGSPANKPVAVEVVQPISGTFTTPSTAIFNSQAINPTPAISIGNSNQQQPFGQ